MAARDRLRITAILAELDRPTLCIGRVLAYDTRDELEHTAQAFFPEVKTLYPFLPDWREHDVDAGHGSGYWLDLLSVAATIDLEPAEPQRLLEALAHLRAAVTHSQAMWAICPNGFPRRNRRVPWASPWPSR